MQLKINVRCHSVVMKQPQGTNVINKQYKQFIVNKQFIIINNQFMIINRKVPKKKQPTC